MRGSSQAARRFYDMFSKGPKIDMRTVEAELAKLFTNMWSYTTRALANEFMVYADEYGANAHRVIDAVKHGTDQWNIPRPGPNVSGPCLYKDGWMLSTPALVNGLVNTAFRVNESMPMFIVKKLDEAKPLGKRVAILGMTFKADSDDVRESLSFKLKKVLEMRGYEPVCIEPNVPGFADMTALSAVHAVIHMTPHSIWRSFEDVQRYVGKRECLYIDLWGYWGRLSGYPSPWVGKVAE